MKLVQKDNLAKIIIIALEQCLYTENSEFCSIVQHYWCSLQSEE